MWLLPSSQSFPVVSETWGTIRSIWYLHMCNQNVCGINPQVVEEIQWSRTTLISSTFTADKTSHSTHHEVVKSSETHLTHLVILIVFFLPSLTFFIYFYFPGIALTIVLACDILAQGKGTWAKTLFTHFHVSIIFCIYVYLFFNFISLFNLAHLWDIF